MLAVPPPALCGVATAVRTEILQAFFPVQLASLAELHTLKLQALETSADGFAPLERLPRLRRLICQDLHHLPACLSRLTGLVRQQ